MTDRIFERLNLFPYLYFLIRIKCLGCRLMSSVCFLGSSVSILLAIVSFESKWVENGNDETKNLFFTKSSRSLLVHFRFSFYLFILWIFHPRTHTHIIDDRRKDRLIHQHLTESYNSFRNRKNQKEVFRREFCLCVCVLLCVCLCSCVCIQERVSADRCSAPSISTIWTFFRGMFDVSATVYHHKKNCVKNQVIFF